MYAIREAHGGVIGGVRSADQYGADWWTGSRWSCASDEARLYETEAEAVEAGRECGRPVVVVEVE